MTRAILKPLLYLWALPTTAIGLPFIPLALISGGKVRLVQGVLEISGGIPAWALRHLTFLKGGAAAMTLGHVVLAQSQHLHNLTRTHERVHVQQCERWGPLFLPAYVFASLLALLKGRRPYLDNHFEKQAYNVSDPRKLPNPKSPPTQP